VHVDSARANASAVTDEQTGLVASLAHIIDHAAHLLPAQGPIPVFIHHNTLHAFEHLPFTDAVVKGAELFGCQPYLSEDRFRDELARGRIRHEDVQAALREELGDAAERPVALGRTRFQVRWAMLQAPLRGGTTEELRWFVAETDALRRVAAHVSAADRSRLVAETRRWALRDLRGSAEVRGTWVARGLADLFDRFGTRRIEDWGPDTWEAFGLQAMWRICLAGVADMPQFGSLPPPPIRHRDLLLRVAGADSDLLVHDVLIRFCAAFLDQGLGHWALPHREQGFFKSFSILYQQPGGPPFLWRRGLAAELKRIDAAHLSPLESICESLTALGVARNEWDAYISATLLALRGWAGIIRFLEERPDRAVHAPPTGSLVEYLAIRLILERLALAHLAATAFGYAGPLHGLRAVLRSCIRPFAPLGTEQRAFSVFQLAQTLGWSPPELLRLDPGKWQSLLRETETFADVERRKIFHLAYEGRFYIRCLDAISLHAIHPSPTPRPARFQAIFCIDEREESIRRHLEEVAPDAETFGTAGFFSIAMYYKGAADAHFTPLCPAVFLPKHWVTEEVAENGADDYRWRANLRRAIGSARYHVHVGNRRFLTGALLAAAGVMASVPLVTRTLFPRQTARVRQRVGEIFQPQATRLHLERADPMPGLEGPNIGYTLEEMTAIGEKVLRDIGLIDNFSRLIFVFGHGSTSMNNPHESAHDCGACGGSRGGPNGRALAQILNDPRVRDQLAERGITIPGTTWFVGGMHNTSSEALAVFDADCVPDALHGEFERAFVDLQAACDRDAHERARRFESAPLTLSLAAARRHMQGRAEDLSQVRPEWGHATNALCIVGRRERTRGLFLDRRAFLNSYDPTQDDADATILTRTLQAVFPVCGGINLEYYFSYVDNPGYGCGTKLPHNITSLLGVMDGAGSDLRTGLPWQMVEIHEPVRLLVVIETCPEVILNILEKHPPLGQLVRNDWIMLAILDPNSSAIQMYRDGSFHPYEPQAKELPQAPTSIDWYRGWRDHLEFAAIG
jgi:uncharacterized protein